MGILYLIVLVLGMPFGIGFLAGWLIGRNKKHGTEEPNAYEKGFAAGRQAAAVEAEHHYAQEAKDEPETALERAQGAMATVSQQQPETVTLSEEEQEQHKAERDTKNINTTLYVASFLLVAAAALFIGTALPESIKFVGVWVVVALFYIGGLVLHSTVRRLQPAAVAFVGTGLALLPFTGLALYGYVIADAPLAWFVTSVIGVAAFLLATLRLQSQVIAYITMAFIFSFATSSLAVLQVPFLWYFVIVILVAVVFNLIASWRPQLVPEVFRQPLDVSGQVAAPVAVAASLLTYSLTLLEVTAILSVAALHYAVASLKPVVLAYKEPYLFAAKALLSVAVTLLVYDVSGGDWSWTAYAMIIIGLTHQLYAVYRRKATLSGYDVAWLWAGFGVQIVTLLFWNFDAVMITLNLLLLIAVSGLAVYKSRIVWYGAVGVGSFALLPIVVGYGVIDPPLEAWAISLIFLVASAGVLYAGLKYKDVLSKNATTMLTIAYGLYLAEGGALAATEQPMWMAVLFGLVACIVMAISYVHKQPLMQYVANAALVYAAYNLTIILSVTYDWRWLVTGIIAGGLFYGLRWFFEWMQEKERADTAFYSAIVLLVLPSLGVLWALSAELANAAAMTLLVAGGIVLFEGYIKQQPRYYDAAFILLTVAMQRMYSIAQPDADILIYTHWWAVVASILAYYYYSLGYKDDAKWRGVVALSLVSFCTGMVALASGGVYQLIFLGEHVALLVVGLLFTNRLVSIWGAVGISLSLLWMLRGFTYVWLTLIAFGLISFAIWRLLNKRENDSHDE